LFNLLGRQSSIKQNHLHYLGHELRPHFSMEFWPVTPFSWATLLQPTAHRVGIGRAPSLLLPPRTDVALVQGVLDE
jgi:hypothetical protein